ncbi:hypothetical protein DUI87_08585 [Hirundo rustica rustica]|uniref:Uncharacterized protein n=1 Tax=Hirundo rustica rustica TaxID=333673 RepID=A0A3M0KJT4_HIRRU|nr:hypothetical protein DUI87_08585 [Hirundo rustica rustica]
MNLAKVTWMVNTQGSINRAGPAQSEHLHTVDGDKVPVVHMKGSQWKNRIPDVLQSQFLSSWEELAPPPLCGASPNGMMECVMSLVGHNGPLSEDVLLEDGGVVKEIRNTAPPGFNGWAMIRRHLPPSPLELQEKDKTSPKKLFSTDEIEYTFLGYIIQYSTLNIFTIKGYAKRENDSRNGPISPGTMLNLAFSIKYLKFLRKKITLTSFLQ